MAAKSDDGLRALSTTDFEEAQWVSKGLVMPMPDYDSGAYGSERCGRLTNEQAANLYNHRMESRKDVLLRDTLQYMVKDKDGEKAAPGEDASDAEVIVFLDQVLAKVPETPIDYSFVSEYSAEHGFWFAVDSGRGLHRTAWCSATHCVAPPANLYADPPLTSDVRLTLTHDLTSSAKHPRWDDGLIQYANEPYEAQKCVIIGLHTLERKRGDRFACASVAWALLPLFSPHGPYLRTGVYRLSLWEGTPPKGLLTDLELGKQGDQALADAVKSNQIHEYRWGSVVVRLVRACACRAPRMRQPNACAM